MSDWGAVLWLLALIAVVLLGEYGAVLLVRAEERELGRADAERRERRRASVVGVDRARPLTASATPYRKSS